MKIVINRKYGGFSLSEDALRALNIDECGMTADNLFIYNDEFRTYPPLIRLIEQKGGEYVSGSFAKLKIVEIPDDVKWKIRDYDGMEVVTEIHREWC